MNGEYFYTVDTKSPFTGYEYNKNSDLGAVGYFSLVNDSTISTIPEEKRELVNQLIAIDSGDVILEYDLDQVTDNRLPIPAIFKALAYPLALQKTVELMWEVSGLTPTTLPTLTAGLRYTHIGCFINRPNSGIRLNVSGGAPAIKQFVLEHNGDPHWIDRFDLSRAIFIATFDFIDGAVKNIRLEIHRGPSGFETTNLENDPWVQEAYTHSKQAIQKYYPNNTPTVIISHYKVGANSTDIQNNYLKMYTEAQWTNGLNTQNN